MIDTVVVVGVGLIGGSFAMAIRKAGYKGKIIGVSSPETLAQAMSQGVIDEEGKLQDVAVADIVYLAYPISKIIELVPDIGLMAGPETLVTDAGSTKQAIVNVAADTFHWPKFLGGHPMAGKEARGVSAASADLFQGRPYVLTPRTDEDLTNPRAVEFRAMLESIGARVVVMSAEEHDRAVAFASHLPQLASVALASTVPQGDYSIAGPGLNDMTRLALSSWDIWRDIVATNGPSIEAALDCYIAELQKIRAALPAGDLEASFASAAANRKLLS